MQDWNQLSVSDLEKKLAKLRAELEELEEEQEFVLKQTGYHVSGGTVKRYAAEVQALKNQITQVEQALKSRAG